AWSRSCVAAQRLTSIPRRIARRVLRSTSVRACACRRGTSADACATAAFCCCHGVPPPVACDARRLSMRSLLFGMILVLCMSVPMTRAGDNADALLGKAKTVLAKLEGDVHLPGLQEPVEVLRD